MSRYSIVMADKTLCLVPFCRRWTRRDVGREWICADHWQRVPRMMRAVYRRAWRRWDRAATMMIVIPAGQVGEGCRKYGVLWRRDKDSYFAFAADRHADEYWAAVASFRRVWRRIKRAALDVAL